MRSLLPFHGSQAHKPSHQPPPSNKLVVAQAGLKNQFLSHLLATEVSLTQPDGGYWMPF